MLFDALVTIGVALVTADNNSALDRSGRPSALGRLLGPVFDALMLLAVLAFSALAVMVIAVAAPLALAVSAIVGVLAPAPDRKRWREAQAA